MSSITSPAMLGMLFAALAFNASAQPTKPAEEKPAPNAPASKALKKSDKKAAEPSTTCIASLKGARAMKARISTSFGPIVIEIDKTKAPITAENFATYADAGHYNGTVFHRVIDGFMIQGGGFDKDMVQRPTRDPIKNEAANGLTNEAYTVAMARTNVRDSATSQFFISVKKNEFLNYRDESPSGWGYAVFGKVIDGQDTVDKIKKVPTDNNGPRKDVPLTPVVIEKVACF